MFNFKEYRTKPLTLADRLVWFGMVAPGIILNKTGSLQRTCVLQGHDLDTSSQEMLELNCHKLNHIFKQIGSGWSLYFDVVRSKTVAYPKSTFDKPVCQLIDLERQETFKQEHNFYESKYYLTFVYLPRKDSELNLANKFVEGGQTIDRQQDIANFKKVTDGLLAALRVPFATVAELDDSETLTYLHSLISTKNHKVATIKPAVYLDCMLTDTPLLGGLMPKLGEQYFKVLTIRFLPSNSLPCLLDGLNDLNIEFRWTSRWLALDKNDAKKQIEKKMRGWMSKRLSLFKIVGKMLNMTSSNEVDSSDAVLKQEDAANAKMELETNSVAFGAYTATVIVYDEDLTKCQQKFASIMNFINDKGFVCKEESINAIEAWFGSLPGHCHANVRYPLVSSINFAHFISISSAWAGSRYNNHFKVKFGSTAPLMLTQTKGNTPFRLNLHQGDVGHTLLLGPTGKGKSTLLNILGLQFLRYPKAQVFFFDKGYSAKVATYAAGGTHYEFNQEQGKSLSLQPLSTIDIAADREWAENWLQGLLEQQGLKLTVGQKQELRNSLTNLASCKPEYRTLLNLKVSLQEKEQTMAMALEKFVTGGPYGYLLDGNKEEMSAKDWVTFELEALMENAIDAIEPVLTCLFYKLEKRFTGRPTLLILDESWAHIKHPFFAARIEKWLRELRKNEVAVVFSSQSLTDALKTKLMSILLESCQTKIFLPNQEALNPEVKKLYQEIGLNAAQINIVANAIPKRQYFYFSSQGVRLFDLAMGELALAICCNAGKAGSKACDAVFAKAGSKNFLAAWLKSKGITWAANSLMQQRKDIYACA